MIILNCNNNVAIPLEQVWLRISTDICEEEGIRKIQYHLKADSMGKHYEFYLGTYKVLENAQIAWEGIMKAAHLRQATYKVLSEAEIEEGKR